MSGFVNGSAMQALAPDDTSHAWLFIGALGGDAIFSANILDLFVGADSFATEWWPGNDVDSGASLGQMGKAAWGRGYPVSGASSRFAIIGYTRDAYGSPISYATVKLFRTSDDSLQASIVSDVNGLYSVSSPYADGHYLVVYKAGPPDVCGTTINTLAPG